MDGHDVDRLIQRLAGTLSRRAAAQAFGGLTALGAIGRQFGQSAAVADAPNSRKHHHRRCRRLPTGSECNDPKQCCSQTCAPNTAFPQFDKVCCKAAGATCVFGANECCGDLGCDELTGTCG